MSDKRCETCHWHICGYATDGSPCYATACGLEVWRGYDPPPKTCIDCGRPVERVYLYDKPREDK